MMSVYSTVATLSTRYTEGTGLTTNSPTSGAWPVVVVHKPQTAVLPRIDRPRMVFWAAALDPSDRYQWVTWYYEDQVTEVFDSYKTGRLIKEYKENHAKFMISHIHDSLRDLQLLIQETDSYMATLSGGPDEEI